ncbi:MAG: radical SAM protein [Deltaproteobacteria bacterium]|nr:radical SAM protein [Deltaproteobacteria bacterium]
MTDVREDMLERERIANRKKHWVRAVTACNSRCLFCLDSDTPRNLFLPFDDVVAELSRGRTELDADKVIISGGEASLHPRFHELVAAAKGMGYDRVQTVTNGWMFADAAFYKDAVVAGLGEITFSLHGHTEALHDHLTQHPGSFKRLIKGMVRAVRRREVIVNADVVINKQNVGVIDRVLELCIGLGVTEFDLLHVIPQAAAFEHRDELFYDPREHIETLHKVFRLNRHPGFVVWTNRFPVSYLEGLEDLIQDPHKMLDEVNGRRYQVRRYLDGGAPLDCRQPERCVHCFIEPFCTSADRVIASLRDRTVQWLDLGASPRVEAGELVRDGDSLAFGAGGLALGLGHVRELAPLNLPSTRLLLAVDELDAESLALVPPESTLEVGDAGQLDLLLGNPGQVLTHRLSILLNVRTAPWLLEHRAAVEGNLDAISIRQPTWERLSDAAAEDVRDPAAFFRSLALPVPVSGLPACLAPGARLVPDPVRLPVSLFDSATGRLAIRPLAVHHVDSRYRARSLRCVDCSVESRCEGPHINMVRDQGLSLCAPVEGEWAASAASQLEALYPEPPPRLATGRPPELSAPSLPGFAGPGSSPQDPLAVLARDKAEARRRRRLEILG